MKKHRFPPIIYAFLCLVAIFLAGCTKPVPPDFQFEEGLVFVEGLASTEPGVSFVAISVSAIEFEVYVVNFLSGAQVLFTNVDTDATVGLTETDGVYVPPEDFRVRPGERWRLDIILTTGKRYQSEIEPVLEPVPINDIGVRYDPELEFREIGGGRFVPGHELFVSFEDPADRDNYYYWNYRSYENLDICEKCRESYFREGNCIAYPRNLAGLPPYYDYPCQSACWRIRFPENIALFEDEFSDGRSVDNFSIGNALLYTKEDMVVEIRQNAITAKAHEYYGALKDLIENSSGLNAPPPVALIGNMYNPDDSEDFIFGRFTPVATSRASLFIDRTSIEEAPLEPREPLILEPTFQSPLPGPATVDAPCNESRYRTAIPPPGWIAQ